VTPLIVSTVIGSAAVLVWRVREGRSPVTLKKIILPPLGMSTGLAMFLYPPTRIPPAWGLLAFALGALLLAYPLVVTSRLTREGEQIMMKRSKAFLWVLLSLVSLRFALRDSVGHWISPLQTASLCYLLALGMVLRWRLSMLAEFRALSEP
jgi:membrane protein CcdC involved in cytochrome C biogenesis